MKKTGRIIGGFVLIGSVLLTIAIILKGARK